MQLKAMQKAVVSALEDIKAHDITVIDMRKMSSFTDMMIIASADSVRQTKALASHVQEKLKDLGVPILGAEGEQTGEWVLVDLGIIVVHIMQPAVREYYNLEELWQGTVTKRAKRASGKED